MIVWLLCGYVWLFIYRPFEIWPAIGALHVERLYMALTVVVWVISPKRLIVNRLHAGFAAIAMALCLCWAASSTRDAGMLPLEHFFKILFFAFLAMTAVTNEVQLRRICAAFLASMFLYLLHSLWEYRCGRYVYRMGTARMIGVNLSFGDPNTFAATIVYSLPMLLPFWRTIRGLIPRLMVLGYLMLAVVCLLLTGSRGGLIGLAFCGMMVVAASRHRVKLGLACAALLPVLWFSMPADRQMRYLTIINPSYGPANAQESAESRWEFMRIAGELWQRSPIVGYGPGAFAVASGTGMQPHSLYSQVAAELGSVGIGSLLVMLGAFVLNAREMRRRSRDSLRPPGFCHHLSAAVSLSVLLLLLLGFSGHNLLRYTWYWYGAFQAIALYCVRNAPAAVRRPSPPRTAPAGRFRHARLAPLRPVAGV